jgi:hypothetical protein
MRWSPTLLVLLILPVIAAAQSYPPPVQQALDDLQKRLGVQLTDQDFNWRYEQKNFSNSALGCPQPDQSYLQSLTLGYQVWLIYQGVEWDYRISSDGTTMILCNPQSTPAPTLPVTNTPPPLPRVALVAGATATPAFCEASPEPRMLIGLYGRVVPEGLANNVRELPTSDSPRLGELPPGAVFYVLDGPRCGDGYAWWYVADTTSDLIGWTPEGLGPRYWLEPLIPENYMTPTPVTPTLTPAPTFTPLPATATPFVQQTFSLGLFSMATATPGG